ncbi:MAG: ABC transporter ATP-binding protein/permease [Anaerolineae bacterium]|nr:ABC transporter ATP-binding protein/permease [Anaerolineae bacterium]
MSFAIQTRDLTKRFPKPGRFGLNLPFAREEGTLAVDRVNVEVGCGEVFGLVGPNGAGKTTLVKILSTLILPTAGTARVNGHALLDEHAIKSSIGLVTGNERSFYNRLTCRENLRFYAGLYGLSSAQSESRVDKLASLLELGDFIDKRYDTCSTGMKHRLALACGLINDPQLLFLDEPTRSLDPLAASRFRDLVYALAHREGHTIFLVTHDLEEAVELCDRAAVMLRGRLRAVGSPHDLPRLIRPQEKCRLDVSGFTPQMVDRLSRLDGVLDLAEHDAGGGGTCVELQLEDRKRVLPAALRAIREDGGIVDDLAIVSTSWDEAFESLSDPQEMAEEVPSVLTAPQACDQPEAADSADRLFPEDGLPGQQPGFSRAFRGLRVFRSLRVFRKPLLFLRRDFKMQMSYRLSFVLQFFGMLFSSSSFYFVSQLLGASAAQQMSSYGGDYFSFVLIGIAFVGYQGVALHAFSGVVQSAQSAGTLEAMLVTPTRLSTILFSSSLWNFVFTSFRVLLYILMGMLVFGADLRRANVLAGLVILCLTIVTLSGIGILSACFVLVFKRGNPVDFVFGSLSSLLGGVYYPVQVLPDWLQVLARFFPLTYSLEAMRRALLAGASLADLWREIAVLVAFSVLLLPLSLFAFRYAVRRAKRDGSLTQF